MPKVQRNQESSRLPEFMSLRHLQSAHKRVLSLIHENYANSLEIELSSFLKADLNVKLHNTKQCTFSAYSEKLENPSFICIFYVEKLSTYGLIEVHPKIIYSIVDRMTGGDGKPPKEIKPFTELELAVTRKFVDLLIRELEKEWSHLVPISFEAKEIQTNPFLVNVITPQEVCVVMTQQFTFGDLNEMMTVCFPYSEIEPLMVKAQKQEISYAIKNTDEVKEAYHKVMGKIFLEMKGILGELQLTMKELSSLQVGDVLDLGKKRHEGVILRIGNKNKFQAHLGLVGKFRGLSIMREIEEEK